MGIKQVEAFDDFESPRNYLENAGASRSIVLLFVGIAIGAGLALLLSPKSGPELREAVGRGYRKTRDGLTGRAQDLKERAQNIGGELRERVPNLLRFNRRRLGRTGPNL